MTIITEQIYWVVWVSLSTRSMQIQKNINYQNCTSNRIRRGAEVQAGIPASAPMALQGVKLLAVYKAAAPGSAARAAAVTTVKEWISDAATGNNPLVSSFFSTFLDRNFPSSSFL